MIMRKILLFLIVILLIAAGFLGYLVYQAENRAKLYTSETQEVFTIESGQGKDTILQNLYDSYLIDSKFHAKVYIKRNDIAFYAGDFGLSQAMTDEEVLEIISNPASNIDTSREFLITEGSTLDTIANDLAEFTLADDSAEQILNIWSDEQNLQTIISNYDFVTDEILNPDILYPLEGYFFPATYKLSDDATIEEITKVFLDTMEAKLETIDTSSSELTIHQILTLASVVERETLLDDDKPIAAGVFFNRIEAGMPLQSDITVLYAKQEHKEQVLYEDLEFESPYNTYLNKGLTPGPISTVSVPSIEAVVNPDQNDYLFFFADQTTGELYFSTTNEEHEEISSTYAWDFNE